MVALSEEREAVPPSVCRSDPADHDCHFCSHAHGRHKGCNDGRAGVIPALADRRCYLHRHRLEVCVARSVRIPAVRQCHHLQVLTTPHRIAQG